MVSRFRSFSSSPSLRCAVAALGAAPAPDDAPVTLAVTGRANANVSIAAREALVVAAWGASRDGAADVYAAVSRDGGRSFGAPVRVNATPGEAALGGERAPRVAIASRTGGPAIAVLWTAKAPAARADAPAGVQPPGPVIRLAESTDLGRTFAAPIDLSGRNVPGHPRLGRARGRRRRRLVRGVARWPRRGREKGGRRSRSRSHGGDGGGGRASPPRRLDRRRTAAGGVLSRGRRDAAGRPKRSARPASASAARPRSSGPARTGRPGARDMVLAWRHIFPNSERDIALSVLDPAAGRPGRMMRVSEDRWQLQGVPRRRPRAGGERQRHDPRRVADPGGGGSQQRTGEGDLSRADDRRPHVHAAAPARSARQRRRRIPSSRRSRRDRPWRCGTRSPMARAASWCSRFANRRRRRSSAQARIRRSPRSTTASWSPGRPDRAMPRSSASSACNPSKDGAP